MDYEAFLAWRARLRQQPALLDLGEPNLYRSLAGQLPTITASPSLEARYRCHVAERYLERLDLTVPKERALVTHGVRRSLSAIFHALAARGSIVALPSDVYPVYLTLAAEAGVRVHLYEARTGQLGALADVDALVVCAPLKPWGGLGPLAAARAWARALPGRLLVVDSAYATPPLPDVRAPIAGDEAVVLSSLSKGWLLPDHVGLAVLPSWATELRSALAALAKDERKYAIGYAALTEHADRPAQVAAALRARAAQLDALTRARPALRAGACHGYFAVAERSAEELVAAGVLGIPATVFGGPAHLTVLSSLAPAPE